MNPSAVLFRLANGRSVTIDPGFHPSFDPGFDSRAARVARNQNHPIARPSFGCASIWLFLLAALMVGATGTARAQGLVLNLTPGDDIPSAVAQVGAAGGGTVNLAAGTYALTQSIVMSSNTTVSGAGPTTHIQLPHSPNGIAAFTSYGGANMTIENMLLDGETPRGAFVACCGGLSNPYQNSGVNMYSLNGAHQNVTLKNLELRNFARALFFGTVNGLTIDTVYLHDNNPGLFAHNAYFVACNNVNIIHSRFDYAHTGDGLHIDFGGVNTTISKSEFSGNNGYGILSQENVNVTFEDSITDFNTNDGIQVDAAGLYILRDRGSYNGGYGFDVPDTLDGNGTIDGYYEAGDGAGIGYLYEASLANLGIYTTANLYEAEEADGVIGANDTADWTYAYPGYTGEGAVDFNARHLADGLLTFSHVGSGTKAVTPLVFRYSNGSGSTLSMTLIVNGKTLTPLSFPSTGSWSNWSTVTANATLIGGNNVVQIKPTGTAAPEIDNLQVMTTTPSAPDAPANLTAQAVDPYTVTLTWTAPATASTYNVFRNGRTLAVNLTTTSYTDGENLLGNASLEYEVQAVNQGGGSSLASVSITTPVDAPAGLQAATGNGAGNYLSWMSAQGAAYYNLKRSAVYGGTYTTVATIPNTTSPTSSNYTQIGQDTTATPGVAYFYEVSSVDGNGNESANNPYAVSVRTPVPTFTVALAPSSFTLVPGQSVTSQVTLTPLYGFTGAVNWTLKSLPSGMTGSVAATSTPYTYTLTLTATSALAPGSYTPVLSAGQGSLVVNTSLGLSVYSQLITFNPIAPQAVGTSLTVSATATSGLPVSFTVVPNGNCSISGDVVTFLNTGNCGVIATQSGNATYGPAPAVGQIIQVVNP